MQRIPPMPPKKLILKEHSNKVNESMQLSNQDNIQELEELIKSMEQVIEENKLKIDEVRFMSHAVNFETEQQQI